MGWKQFVRSTNAAVRRSERAALRRHRELQKEYQQQVKASQRQQAADEVNQFENYLALLVSVHADCNEGWDWQRISSMPPPRAPAPPGADSHAALARLALDTYRPGFFDRLFGQVKKTVAQLETAVLDAEAADQRDHERAMVAHRQATESWNTHVRLASGVMRLELDACRAALEHVGAFEELRAFKTSVSLGAILRDGAALICRIEDAEIVPREELKLTAGGKLSTKDMAVARYWALYKDHVCSCALRVARETFAALPVASATVNVQVVRLDPRNGHVGPATILGARFTREALGRLSFEAINSSAALADFPHRMSFKKTTGFQTIEPLSDSEVEASLLAAPSALPVSRAPANAPGVSSTMIRYEPARRISVRNLENPDDGDQAVRSRFAGIYELNTVATILANRPGNEQGLVEIVAREWDVSSIEAISGWLMNLHQAGVFKFEEELSSTECERPVEQAKAPVDEEDKGTPDPEQDFIIWLVDHLAGRGSANFKIKTLVNQLGHYRADRRLSLKAVHDLAEVLATAGYEIDPELRGANRSPGIDARVRVSRKLSPEERSAAAYQDAARWVALSRFLWGAGYRKLCVSAETTRPRFDELSVDNVADLLRHLQVDPVRNLVVLESLVSTGALEHWLLEAQHDMPLAVLASGIRRDQEPHKAERWLSVAIRR